MESEQTRQLNFELPPRAGLIGAVALSAVAGSQNLALLDNQAVNLASADALQIGPLGCDVTFIADGTDAYVVFGPTSASVTAGNAPVAATTGVNAAGVAMKFPNNVKVRLKLTAIDQWIGFVGAATGTLRFYRSSPYAPAC